MEQKIHFMIRDLHYLKAIGYNFINENFENTSEIKNFESLKESVSKCTLCHFSKTRKHALIEKKAKKVKLFIIDSYAQKSENESGNLLESKKGEILKQYLYEILGLKQECFYFSYLFKCFSASKIDNFSLQSCLPFLLSELKLIQPNFILCLGEYAFKALGFEAYNTLRGEIFAYQNSFMMASFGLDFIERNPSLKKDFIEDLKKIKGYL